MKSPSMMNNPVMDPKTGRALFVWLLLTGWFGVLAGLPWTLAVLRDYPTYSFSCQRQRR